MVMVKLLERDWSNDIVDILTPVAVGNGDYVSVEVHKFVPNMLSNY